MIFWKNNQHIDKYYEKYIKYKLKYNKLKNIYPDLINNLTGGVKYDCNPENKFADICIEKDNGHYRTKESCINDCENKYITHNLVKANIKGESLKFQLFIKDINKRWFFKAFGCL